MELIPLHVQTLYAELIAQCRAGSGQTGSLYERTIGGERYTYLKAQVGVVRQDFYIGKTTVPATVGARKLIEQANASSRTRKQLVQTLKQLLPSPHTTAARVIEVLKWGGVLDASVLVGTNAYTCYPALVGARLQGEVMSTDDADIATMNLSVKSGDGGRSFEQLLQMADPTFKAVPSLAKADMPSQFKSENGYRVDLLTQMRSSRSERAVPLAGLQAGATPLQHLKWLTQDPSLAVILSGRGTLVNVPQPARYAIHKLIVAQKRVSADRLKRQKDLMQAKSLILVLRQTDPASLHDAYDDACEQGKKGWAVPLQASLAEIALMDVFS